MDSIAALTALAETLTARPTTTRAHQLRVVDPSTGSPVWTSTVGLGSEWSARRVTRPVGRLFAAGGRVEVMTCRGWEPRRVVVGRDGAHYLRMP